MRTKLTYSVIREYPKCTKQLYDNGSDIIMIYKDKE